MSRRQLKKSITRNIDRILENAQDVATTKHVFWIILALLDKRSSIIADKPFNDAELNNLWHFIYNRLVSIAKNEERKNQQQ